MYLSFSIEGEQQLSRRLRGITAKLDDFSVPFGRSARKLLNTFQNDVFSTKGGAVGEKWAPLSPYTLADKDRKGYGNKGPLIRTGLMKDSFTSEVDRNAFVIYNTAEYFKYHQSNKPRLKIPRRQMLKLGPLQRELIVKDLLTYIRNDLGLR